MGGEQDSQKPPDYYEVLPGPIEREPIGAPPLVSYEALFQRAHLLRVDTGGRKPDVDVVWLQGRNRGGFPPASYAHTDHSVI
jgi:hypothetical protein